MFNIASLTLKEMVRRRIRLITLTLTVNTRARHSPRIRGPALLKIDKIIYKS